MAKPPWTVERLVLYPPPLSELVPIISSSLKTNFKDVSVSVSPCPDLRQAPFNLAAAGLCGHEQAADIGGPPNLAPLPKLDRQYSLLDMTKLMEMQPSRGFVLGASAGPFHVLGTNSELTPNLAYDGDTVTNLSRYAKIDDQGTCCAAQSPSTDFGLMGNLYGCDGLRGDVLKITASTRTGRLNFTETIRQALGAEYNDRVITFGGVFVIKQGKAKIHVMPDFSKVPLETRREVDEWIRYFDMSAPLVCLSVFHSYDPGLDLRMEHTHCFSDRDDGGHYHYDVTPDEVQYEAYFNVARVLYRIDQPDSSQQR